jgi:Flp pilus assembly protein TadG
MRTKQKLTLLFNESGATAIFFALTLSVLCGFVALAFDVGHMVMVRAELQRTADAAALAGVTGLVPYTGGVPQTPAWASSVARAHNMISNPANLADNLKFTTSEGTVDYGYWKLNPPAGYVQPPSTGLPRVRPPDTELPEPAITVTVSRQVTLSFAPIVGVTNPRTVSATATAILPEIYGVTGLPPIAFAWDVVYNIVNGTTVVDASDQDIKIQSNKGLAGWFNLDGGNGVPSVRFAAPLIAESNGISGGTQVYMVPGTKATLTNLVTQGSTIVVPVVQNDFEQKSYYPIIGWAAFQVDSLDSNSMTGHFVTQYFDPNINPDPRPNPDALFVSGTPKLVAP